MEYGIISNKKKIDGIGEVSFFKSKKFRRLSIFIKNDMSIMVKIPLEISFNHAESFVKKKNNWIKKQKERISKKIILKKYQIPSEKIVEDFIFITTKKIQSFSLKYNLKYNKLSFKWMKSRWGSCSYKNNITLNLWMMFLPKNLKDYIILHELVHIKIKNHSKEFWIELGKICENPRLFNKRLNSDFSI